MVAGNCTIPGAVFRMHANATRHRDDRRAGCPDGCAGHGAPFCFCPCAEMLFVIQCFVILMAATRRSHFEVARTRSCAWKPASTERLFHRARRAPQPEFRAGAIRR